MTDTAQPIPHTGSLPPDSHSGSNPDLYAWLAQRLADHPQHRITFAEFMDAVLYHPQHGYYAAHADQIGLEGDFVTSPHLGSDFAELLAVQLAQMWDILGQPHPFYLVEMGAGQGRMAEDLLRYLHKERYDCFAALHYLIVEQSAALIAAQQQRLAPMAEAGARLSWPTWDEIPADAIVGCCFSNELPDAFPVHQVIVHQGKLRELYVTLDAQGQFQEVVDDLSTPQLTDYFTRIGIELTAYPDGYRTEVNLAALDWLQTVAERLQRGYVLTIDYGHPASRYYSPARSQGTLQCYYQHGHHSNPYSYLGHQDLTSHVDFTTLQQQGERCGLHNVGFTQQGLFLMALGLGDRLADLSTPTPDLSFTHILHRREVLHALMNPMGLGNFGVLVQSKGLTVDQQSQPLRGLTMPPLMG